MTNFLEMTKFMKFPIEGGQAGNILLSLSRQKIYVKSVALLRIDVLSDLQNNCTGSSFQRLGCIDC
jgi:hypothetical protein